MKLLLDTANLQQIQKFLRTDAIAGVTTNPSLMAKESKGDYVQRLQIIAAMVKPDRSGPRHLSVEVTTVDPGGILSEALNLHETLEADGLDLHIKVPVMLSTLDVISELRRRNVKVNATACMNALQAKLASAAGASIVSFFYNRIKDGNEDPDQALKDFVEIHLGQTKIICGSIRKPEDVFRCWCNGADYVTASPEVIQKMIEHPQTSKAIEQFQKDIESWRS